MSYDRRGGRRRYRDDYDDRRREFHETPEEKIRTAIIKLGEVDALAELPRLEKQIREHVPLNIPNLSESFRISVTEQPYKIPFYAALMRLLHEQPEGAEIPSLGRQILEDFWKGFQSYLDKLAWREARLCIQFFAHLTMARLISPDSMISLLQAFTSVLDEFGASHGRAKRAAMCAAEGLMFAGPILKLHSALSVTDIINAIQAYNDTMNIPRWLVQPSAEAHQDKHSDENADELLDTILNALKALNDNDFSETANIIPQPYSDYTEPDASFSPFNVPSVLVPPEVIEIDGIAGNSDEDIQVKKEEWPEFYLRLFDNDVTPDPNTPAGYAVRTALLDIIDIFEVNRKECARLLLEYPKWNLPGTFKPKPGAPVESEPVEGKDWQLESTILETILGAYLVVPESTSKSLYYSSLMTELCKLSPSTVGPAVGKSIRKLYSFLADGLDVDAARRLSEWFAVHMSNFNFQWVWREWIPDLSLPVQHPKRSFIHRAVEYEIRLSYHDRILKTLPEAMHVPDACVIPEQAPGPDFEYDDPSSPYHEAAQSVLNLFRGRAKAEDVIANLETLKSTLESSDVGHANVNAAVRSITMQSLLHIGSRSFSHLLNAIERYLPLLRNLASGGTGSAAGGGIPEAKADILAASALFWKHNRQMIGIVFDKLMQYQIVDPTDVVAWIFSQELGVGEPRALCAPYSLTAYEWDLLKGALDKANGRVIIAKRKVVALQKEDDDTRGRAKATANAMEVDADAKPEDESPAADNPALNTAQKALSILTQEQRAVLSRVLEGFVAYLAPSSGHHANPATRSVITVHSWNNRANWERDEWAAWETWGWYRHFCRAYSPYLRNYLNTLSTVSFSKFEGSSDPAAELLKKTWNVATVLTTSVFIVIFQWLYQKISQTRPFKEGWIPAPSAPSNSMMKEALSSDDDNENSDQAAEAGPSRQNEESYEIDNHSEYEQFPEGMNPEGYSAPFKVVKPLTPEALALYKAAQDKAGIIYISRIPPGMQPAKVRHLMSAYGEVGRVYLQQEDPKRAYLRRKYTSTKKPHFTEGWVEFKDKKIARCVAEMLNAQPIGGKKGTRWRDDVWTMKYLPKFKWHMLTEQVAQEAAIHAAKLRVELSQSRSEQQEYLRNVEVARQLEKRAEKKREKGEVMELKVINNKKREIGEEVLEARKKKRSTEGQLKDVLGQIF